MKNWAFVALASLPILYFVLTQFAFSAPYYINYDPEISYMLSSLSVFKGQIYLYTDHPGTPLQILGSIFFGITFPFIKAAGGNFYTFHLAHPELFLTFFRFLLMAATSAGIFLIGRLVKSEATKLPALSVAGIAVIYFAAHPQGFNYTVIWSHNSVSFPFAALLSIYLVFLGKYFKGWKPLPWAIYGLGAGVLTASQIFFGAWVIGGAVAAFLLSRQIKAGMLKSLKHSAIPILGSAAGFFVVTTPILDRYPALFGWLAGLLLHQGKYGSGPRGITSVDNLWSNLLNMLTDTPVVVFFVITSILGLGILFIRNYRTNGKARWWYAIGAGLLIQLLVLLAAILKHYLPKYLLSVAAILPALFFLMFLVFDGAEEGGEKLTRYGLNAFGAFAIIMAFWNFGNSVVEWRQVGLELENSEAAALARAQEISAESGGGLILLAHGVYTDCNALIHGDGYAGRAFEAEIREMCKGQRELNIWNRKVKLGGAWRTLDEIDWSVIVTTDNILSNYGYLASYGSVEHLDIQMRSNDVVLIKNETN